MFCSFDAGKEKLGLLTPEQLAMFVEIVDLLVAEGSTPEEAEEAALLSFAADDEEESLEAYPAARRLVSKVEIVPFEAAPIQYSLAGFYSSNSRDGNIAADIKMWLPRGKRSKNARLKR